MPVIGPLEDSYLTEKDIKSVADSLVFLVTLSTGNNDPTLEPGLPKLRTDRHPIDNRAIAEQYQIEQWVIPGVSCFVRVMYSSDGRFQFPPRNPDQDPGFKAWEITSAAVVMEVPILIQRPVLKGCTGGSAQWSYQWFRENFKIWVGTTNVIREVTVGRFTTSDRLAIEAQVNRLHLLDPNGQGTTYYRFLGADEKQTSPTVWKIRYRWIRDKGNRAPQSTAIPPTYSGGVVLPPPRGSYEAYQVFYPLGGFDPCNQSSIAEPQILTVKTYDERPAAQGGDVDPTGARDLQWRPLD